MNGDDTPTYGSLSSFPQASSAAHATGETISGHLVALDEAVDVLSEHLTTLYHRLDKVMQDSPPTSAQEEKTFSSAESSISQRICMARLKIQEIDGMVEHIHRRLEI